MSSFVRRLTISKVFGSYQSITDPSWSEVELALGQCRPPGAQIELLDESETQGMTIFCDRGLFHIGVTVSETDYFFFWNGEQATGQSLDIAGHSFPGHQVLDNVELVLEIAKVFWSTGQRFGTVKWIEERVE